MPLQSSLSSVVTAALILASPSTVGTAWADAVSAVPSAFGQAASHRIRSSHRRYDHENASCGISVSTSTSTRAQVFNLTRCGDPDRFSVYVYPPPPASRTAMGAAGPPPGPEQPSSSSSHDLDPSRFWSQIIARMRQADRHDNAGKTGSTDRLARSINFTDNPDEACLLVPTVPVDCFENKCKIFLVVAQPFKLE